MFCSLFLADQTAPLHPTFLISEVLAGIPLNPSTFNMKFYSYYFQFAKWSNNANTRDLVLSTLHILEEHGHKVM